MDYVYDWDWNEGQKALARLREAQYGVGGRAVDYYPAAHDQYQACSEMADDPSLREWSGHLIHYHTNRLYSGRFMKTLLASSQVMARLEYDSHQSSAPNGCEGQAPTNICSYRAGQTRRRRPMPPGKTGASFGGNGMLQAR